MQPPHTRNFPEQHYLKISWKLISLRKQPTVICSFTTLHTFPNLLLCLPWQTPHCCLCFFLYFLFALPVLTPKSPNKPTLAAHYPLKFLVAAHIPSIFSQVLFSFPKQITLNLI